MHEKQIGTVLEYRSPEYLALEKAEVLPAYLRLYHLTASLTQLAHSLPVHSVRMLSAYYASPTLASMRAGLLPPGLSHDGYTPTEPLLQPTRIRSDRPNSRLS